MPASARSSSCFPTHTPGEVAARLKGNRLRCVLHNLPAGDWEAGERGIACLPDRIDEFRAGVKAIEYAQALGAPQLNCLAGKAPLGADPAMLRQTFVANLRYAAAELKRANLRLLIEPITPTTSPASSSNRTAQAIAIMDEVGADNLFLQYDIYHAQRSEGELAATMAKHLARIAHMQIADNRAATNPARARSTTPSCSRTSPHRLPGFVGCEYKARRRRGHRGRPGLARATRAASCAEFLITSRDTT